MTTRTSAGSPAGMVVTSNTTPQPGPVMPGHGPSFASVASGHGLSHALATSRANAVRRMGTGATSSARVSATVMAFAMSAGISAGRVGYGEVAGAPVAHPLTAA